MPRKIDTIVVHHSDSNWGTAFDIDQWHKQRGWFGIGYHYVILNRFPTYEDSQQNRKFNILDGQIQTGRSLDGDNQLEDNEIGAHAYGFNSHSIGICLIHKDKPYTLSMILSLVNLIIELKNKYNIDTDNIFGHYELNSKKPLCPSIDMKSFRKELKEWETHFGHSKLEIFNTWNKYTLGDK